MVDGQVAQPAHAVLVVDIFGGVTVLKKGTRREGGKHLQVMGFVQMQQPPVFDAARRRFIVFSSQWHTSRSTYCSIVAPSTIDNLISP
jgi:hypothetical protein